MNTSMSNRFLAATLFCGILAGCQDKGPQDVPGARVKLDIAPLTLDDVGNARWRVTVRNGADPAETVWTRELDADRFGDGRGAVSYVGPCDASPGVRTHTVTLELLALYDTAGVEIPAADYQNPTVPNPIVATAECSENADTPVQFNIVVMRRAQQGFFDLAVNFDNVFCSAKMDCPDEFLLYPGNDPQGRQGRGPTAIIAFACTAGTDALGQARPTYLYLNEVKLSCPRAAPADPVVVWVHPTGDTGNLGPRPPLLFQTALYFGREGFTNMNKCFWNLALGVELAEITDGPCQVTVAGTASTTQFQNHETPLGQVWPVVHWDVTLDVVDGALSCGTNPLDGEGSGVWTDYVGPEESTFFTYELKCQDEPVIDELLSCAVGFEGSSFRFSRSASGVAVSYGSGSAATTYAFANPAWRLSTASGNAGCCADSCCTP